IYGKPPPVQRPKKLVSERKSTHETKDNENQTSVSHEITKAVAETPDDPKQQQRQPTTPTMKRRNSESKDASHDENEDEEVETTENATNGGDEQRPAIKKAKGRRGGFGFGGAGRGRGAGKGKGKR
ncbi:hypothetical protein HK100_004738, partial [Physocladia obscura]